MQSRCGVTFAYMRVQNRPVSMVISRLGHQTHACRVYETWLSCGYFVVVVVVVGVVVAVVVVVQLAKLMSTQKYLLAT